MESKPMHQWKMIAGSAALGFVLVFGAAPIVGSTLQSSVFTSGAKIPTVPTIEVEDPAALCREKLQLKANFFQSELDDVRNFRMQYAASFPDLADVIARLESSIERFVNEVAECVE